MKPVLLKPAFKDYLWGGTKLKTEFGKQSDLDIVAESWELSTHKDGQSVVAEGEFKGLKLSEYLEKIGSEAIGTKAQRFDFFPMLIKFIDAKGSLSIQVHPDDAYALEHEKEFGKTEVWYILGCEEGSFLYYGFEHEISKEEFQKRIAENTLLEVLHKAPVKKGDVFFIKAGTVHAIGAGIVICEIQQNSNSTYRVYDFGRRDANGNLRPLHIEQAIAVSKLCPADEPVRNLCGVDAPIAKCEYFTAEKYAVSGEKQFSVNKESFQSLIAVDGEGILEFDGTSYPIKKGDSYFIPAQEADYRVTGNCELILSYV